MLLPTTSFQRHNDRASNELRAYLRDEWHGDAGWLRTRGPAFRESLWARARRWLGRSRAARRRAARSVPPAPAAWAKPATAEHSVLAADCRHHCTEDLGASGLTEFLRCLVCGEILIVQPGHLWQLRPKDAEGRSPVDRTIPSEVMVPEGG